MSTSQLLTTPSGVDIVLTVPYTPGEDSGVTALIVAASMSLLCAVSMLGFLGFALLNTRSTMSENFFIRTHGAAFFTSLLFADVVQAIGTIMSTKWIANAGVELGSFCSTQGAMKNAGNLAVSLWTLMLAIHTFCVLFLRMKPREWSLYAILISLWFFVGFLVVLGPGAIQTDNDGPYFGISGYWCWIADPYPVSRVLLEYAWMFSAAGLSFLLYMLTFLRLRGNITIDPTCRKIKFKRVDDFDPWVWTPPRDPADIQMIAVAKNLIGFPVLFAILILPIAICRFIDWSGGAVPFQATIFADTVFSLTGVFHLILSVVTSYLFPHNTHVQTSEEPKEVQPYHVEDFASAHGFNDMYQSQAEQGMAPSPPRPEASLAHRVPPQIPARSPRPLSFGDMSPTLQVPKLGDVPVRNAHSLDARRSPDGAEGSHDAPWDVVDLDRSPVEDPSPQYSSSRVRDTRFTLSAYQYGEESDSERPPMPMGGVIDIHAGFTHANDGDDRRLMPSRSR